MSGRRILIAAGFAFLAASLAGLDVVLAPLVFQDSRGEVPAAGSEPPRLEADLLRAIAALRPSDKLFVRRANPAGERPPRTMLEASRLCEAHAYEYLLYGFLRLNESSYHAEVKLFESEADRVVVVFFASDDKRHYERLVGDVAAKILAFFHNDVGLAPDHVPEPERNIFRIPCALGYWTPASEDWNRVTAGLAAVTVGARFIPTYPLFTLGRRQGYAAFGLDVDYALAKNEPGYESFFLHTARVRLPVEAFVELAGGHAIGIGVGPLLQIDIMAQDRLYDAVVVETTVVSGASLILSYRYAFSDSFALGFANVLDWAAYADPLLSYSPRLVADFRLRSRRPGGTP